MKKQILTLTMCLALTATAALANGTTVVTQKAAPAKISMPAPVTQTAPATMTIKPAEQPQIMTREEAKKNFEERRVKIRERMYNELGLSTEQKTQAEALDLKNKTEAIPLFEKFKAESKKLSELKNKHASVFKIWQQENVVKEAKKSLESHFDTSRKAFEAILTPEQKAKFEARKIKMEKFKKCHKHCGQKGPHGPEHMGPPPEGMGPQQGPAPVGPPPEKK